MSSGTSAQDTAIELRQAEALKLRVAGFTFREIGRRLGISNCMAHKDVQAALAEYRDEAAENVAIERGVQLQRLDAAAKVAINVLNGRTPNADELGEDAGPDELAEALAEAEEIKLKAIDRIVKLEERRAKLLGLDAPTKTEVDAKVSGVASPSEAARLVREKFGEHASKDSASPEAGSVQGSSEQ